MTDNSVLSFVRTCKYNYYLCIVCTLMFVLIFFKICLISTNMLFLPTEGTSERCLKVDFPVSFFHLPYEIYNIL